MILSARVDEAIIRRIGLIAEHLRTSKKAVIEGAMLACAETVGAEGELDILDRSFGAWRRDEEPDDTARHAREVFSRSGGAV